MSETVTDVIVILDGENKPFFSYMNYDNTQEIAASGLANAERVNLRETSDRPVPESLKKGESCIMDILVRLEPNCVYHLN